MEVLNLYSNDPNTELVISFANAEGLQTSQLTGTDTLDLVPEPATVMLLIFGLIGALTISRRSNK
jgi:hypothetical protein